MKVFILILTVCSIVFCRILPHPANLTPVIALSIFLASRSRQALMLVLFSFFVSDGFLSLIYHYPLWGSWTAFNYSAMAMIIFASRYFRRSDLFFGLSSTLFFWIWTNFGTWLTADMYPLNMQGLSFCYTAALPFLTNSLLGTAAGYGILNLMPIFASLLDKFRRKLYYTLHISAKSA